MEGVADAGVFGASLANFVRSASLIGEGSRRLKLAAGVSSKMLAMFEVDGVEDTLSALSSDSVEVSRRGPVPLSSASMLLLFCAVAGGCFEEVSGSEGNERTLETGGRK